MHAVLDQLMAENRRFADRPGDDDVGAGYDLLESGRRLDHDLWMAGLFGRHEGIERRLGPTPDTHPHPIVHRSAGAERAGAYVAGADQGENR